MGNPTLTGAPRVPPGRDSLAAAFARLNREQLGEIATAAIARLDEIDGDTDLEDDDPAGDPCDAGELDETRGLLAPVYGIDQTLGPINEREMVRDHYRSMHA